MMQTIIDSLPLILLGACVGILFGRIGLLSRTVDRYEIRNREFRKETINGYDGYVGKYTHEYLQNRVRDLEEQVRMLQFIIKQKSGGD
jgi:hypothetical protein